MHGPIRDSDMPSSWSRLAERGHSQLRGHSLTIHGHALATLIKDDSRYRVEVGRVRAYRSLLCAPHEQRRRLSDEVDADGVSEAKVGPRQDDTRDPIQSCITRDPAT
jgi:hypothetical protein